MPRDSRRPVRHRVIASRRGPHPGLAWLVTLGLGLALGAESTRADDRPGAAQAKSAWDDPAISPDERARRALEAAGTLDEQAQRAATIDASRARWLEAAQLLDDCLAKNPQAATAPTLRFQAAVYLWAWSRATLDQADLLPATDPEVVKVARQLDEVVTRLRAIVNPAVDPKDPFAQNVRFRLAQALADRAKLRPEADPARTSALKEALALLDGSIASPRLRAFARLLRAELSNRLGQYGPAQIEVEEAEKLTPPPPVAATTDAKITALAGRGQWAEANQVADRAAVGVEQKALWKLRIVLSRRPLTPGRDRNAIDAEAFALGLTLRDGNRPEARRGLMELARAIDEPGPTSPPEWWDLLVDGHLLLKEPERAAKLATRAAEGADARQPERAAALRFKAAGCWFQAEQFAEADKVLTRLLADRQAPVAMKAKAGMLRAICLGRALAARQEGSTRAAYLAALEAQVHDYPADPVSGEARWLLGKFRVAANRRDEAISLWSAITHSQPRWLDAQTGAADLAIDAVEDQWINHDKAPVQLRLEAARQLIRQALGQANEGDEAVALGLRLARLESIPGIGQPTEAITTLNRILQGPASTAQHDEARLARMVALAEQNRFADAEIIARSAGKGDQIRPLLPSIRLLDRLASDTENDQIRRRTGSLLRILLDRWVDPVDRTPPEDRDEVRLRQARAMLFAGDSAAARRAIARWGGPNGDGNIALIIRDLGDTYFRLEAYEMAVDAERVRASKLIAGSPAWFDARYCLSLALYRSNRTREARKIIDATSILHPDLGGGEIRTRFDRLSQKITADPSAQ